VRKLKSLAAVDCLQPGASFKLDLDLFITEDDVYKLCKLRSDMPDYTRAESKAFLKAVPDPASILFFYVLPESHRSKSRNTFELEAKSNRRVSTNSISNLKNSGNTSLRFDSTMHTLKPQSPCVKQEARNNGRSSRQIDNITSNSKISSQIRSTIMKASDGNCAKKRVSVDHAGIKGLATSLDPHKARAGVNLYQTKSRMRTLSSAEQAGVRHSEKDDKNAKRPHDRENEQTGERPHNRAQDGLEPHKNQTAVFVALDRQAHDACG